MNKIEKMASRDAHEWGLAQMFFGEGAGTRRKLVQTPILQKMDSTPGYREAFDKAYGKLNQIELAEKAIAERKRIDRAAKAGKNLRALQSGRYDRLTGGAFLVAAGVLLAHETGYDKKIEAEVKKQYLVLKSKIRQRQHLRSA